MPNIEASNELSVGLQLVLPAVFPCLSHIFKFAVPHVVNRECKDISIFFNTLSNLYI